MKAYRRTNPRSVRGAVRRNWHLVDLSNTNYVEKTNTSYVGLQIWATRNSVGRYVSSFMPTKFAFENPQDAMLFTLRFA